MRIADIAITAGAILAVAGCSDPDGPHRPSTYAYVTNVDGGIRLTVHPSGRFLYLVNRGDGTRPGTVMEYQVGADGQLALLRAAGVAADAGALALTIVQR